MKVLRALLGSVGILFVLLVLAYEVLAFVTNSPTITDLVRPWIARNPFFAALVLVFVGALIGHFFVRFG